MLSRLHCVLLLFLLFIVGSLVVSGFRTRGVDTLPHWMGTQKIGDLEEPLANLTGAEMARIFAAERENAPSGDWMVAAIPNPAQRTENRVPVLVVAPVSLMATGKITNLIVAAVTLLNAAHQPVESVALKWTLVDTNHEVRAHGQGDWFKVDIDARRARKVKCPYINFAKISQPLVKNGSLTGNFQLEIGVELVRFADGSLWLALN